MHQLGVKNTPHHRHRHATTNYVIKWVGFNWKTRHFPPLAFLRGHWPKRRQKNPPEVFPQDRTAHSENYFVRSYAKWWIQKVYLDKSLRSVEARARGCKVVSKQQQTIGDLNAFRSLLGDPIFNTSALQWIYVVINTGNNRDYSKSKQKRRHSNMRGHVELHGKAIMSDDVFDQ